MELSEISNCQHQSCIFKQICFKNTWIFEVKSHDEGMSFWKWKFQYIQSLVEVIFWLVDEVVGKESWMERILYLASSLVFFEVTHFGNGQVGMKGETNCMVEHEL